MPTAIAARLRSPASRFAASALLWTFGLFALLRLPWVEAAIVWPVTRLQAQLAAALSSARTLPVDVTLACSGTDVLAMCVGAVLAYPVRRNARLAGAAGGIAVILALNVVRIVTLARVTRSPDLFALLHLYVWPAVLALAAAGYVFAWMRIADGAPRASNGARVAHPARRFALITAACIAIFAAASPWYLVSTWVLAAASLIASAAAVLLRLVGISAVASGNLLMTARGGFTVTQECIATPLIPVYVAAVIAFVPSWRRRLPALVAVIPIFMILGVVRLLVVAVPPAIVGSPLFFIHAFYQLLSGVVLVAAAACWRHGAARAWRPGMLGVLAGIVVLMALVPLAGRLIDAGPVFDDAQGAVALLAPFQIALLVSLWIAAVAPARPAVFAGVLALIVASQAGIFLVLHASGGFAMLPAHVPEVRAWALALPLAILLAMRSREPSRA